MKVAGVTTRSVLSSAYILIAIVNHGCGNEDSAGPTPVVAERSTLEHPLQPPNSNPQIDPPNLPECLQGEDPPGCAAPPSLPECMAADGCAQPPVLHSWTCPTDWTSIPVVLPTLDTFSFCGPTLGDSCEPGHAAFMNAATCEPIGPACPTDAFRSESSIRAAAPNANGDIHYVAVGGSGTGSPTDPFGSIADALAAAQLGDILTLGQGSFEMPETLDSSVAIVGNCVAQTTITTTDSAAPTIRIAADDVLVSSLRVNAGSHGVRVDGSIGAVLADVEVLGGSIAAVEVASDAVARISSCVLRTGDPPAGSPHGGVGLLVSGEAVIEDSLVHRCHDAGISAEGTTADVRVERTIVSDTLPLEDDSSGVGMRAANAANLTVESAVLRSNRLAGVRVEGATASLSNMLVVDTLAQASDDKRGHGIWASGGATVDGTQIALEGNRTSGLLAEDDGTVVELHGLVVQDTESQPADGTAGRGLEAWTGATLTVTEAWVTRNRMMGLVAVHAGSLEIEDSFVTATRIEQATGQFGRGLWVSSAGSAKATRVWFEDNRSVGAGATKAGSSLTLNQVTIRSTQPLDDGTMGRGVETTLGAALVASDATIVDNSEFGVLLLDPSTTGQLTRVFVARTLPRSTDGVGGYGIAIWDGPVATIEGMVLRENHALGLFVDNAAATVNDAIVSATQPEADDGTWGGGIAFSGATIATGHRLHIEDNHTVGVLVTESGTQATMEDLTIVGTRASEAMEYLGPGFGLATMDGAMSKVTRAKICGNRNAATVVGDDSTMEAADLLLCDTESDIRNHIGGEGLLATARSNVTVARAVLDSNRSTAVAAYGGVVEISDVVVRNTRAPSCATLEPDDPHVCADPVSMWAPSAGVWANAEGSVDLQRFVSAGAECGLWAGETGWIRAAHGLVQGNAIGASVRNKDLNLTDICGPHVRFVDNQINLDDMSMSLATSDIDLPSLW